MLRTESVVMKRERDDSRITMADAMMAIMADPYAVLTCKEKKFESGALASSPDLCTPTSTLQHATYTNI